MNETQRGVLEFHQKFTGVSHDKPTLIGPERLLLRSRLIIEEASEFVAAASQRDMTGMVDALGDILYVVYGTGVELGIDLEPISREIQRSNMSKTAAKDASGKVQKGPDYFPPDIDRCLKEQGWPCQE